MKLRSFYLRCFHIVVFFALVMIFGAACTIEEDINVLRQQARNKLNVSYTVTFDLNGGSGPPPPGQTEKAGRSIILPGGSGLTKTDYVFNGWNTRANGTGSNYNAGSSYKPTRNITLYARWIPDDDVTITDVELEMVFVPGDSFQMGDANYSYSSPVHTVTLTGFYMSKYEVTQGQYQAVTGSNPSSFSGNNLPVECVTWYDAVEFCNKLSDKEGLTSVYTIMNRSPASGYPITGATVTANWSNNGYRLPTEAEWEYAAKGGNGSPGNYTYAGSNDPDDVAWYSSNSGSRTHEVGTKTANGLGIYDMSGNVWEWCWDWYGSYSSEAQTDPTGASSGSFRVVRGGSWYRSAGDVRSAHRGYYYPYSRGDDIGFRLVRP